MKAVWKYDIAPGINVLWLTPGAQVLKVAKQPGQGGVALWALVDPNSVHKEERVFLITPMGIDLPDEAADPACWRFIDTFFVDGECPVHRVPKMENSLFRPARPVVSSCPGKRLSVTPAYWH